MGEKSTHRSLTLDQAIGANEAELQRWETASQARGKPGEIKTALSVIKCTHKGHEGTTIFPRREIGKLLKFSFSESAWLNDDAGGVDTMLLKTGVVATVLHGKCISATDGGECLGNSLVLKFLGCETPTQTAEGIKDRIQSAAERRWPWTSFGEVQGQEG
jgi:hypothetical protein